MTTRLTFIIALGCTSTACVTAPAIIREPVDGPGVAEVRSAPAQHLGARVRWGGEILRVENRNNSTRLQVVARRLTRSGRPVNSDRTPGRFIAQIDDFLEPTQYQKGRELTVVGALSTSVTKPIGQHDYEYPVVQVEALHLWPQPPTYYGPYPYGPYYRYHYYPYPYWYHPYPYYRPYYYFDHPRRRTPYPKRHLH